ncbi:hypothetical protein ACFVYV_10145 [Streptomyces mirabilis]|uniref:hypothetical protein n=1 Tax=Streptomyces mirabilis TaxID=68239 RepID=UPI0036D7D6C1
MGEDEFVVEGEEADAPAGELERESGPEVDARVPITDLSDRADRLADEPGHRQARWILDDHDAAVPLHRVRLVRLVDRQRQAGTGRVEVDRAEPFEMEPQMQQRRLAIGIVVPSRGHPQQPLIDQVGGEQLLIVGHPLMFAWLSLPWRRVSLASKPGRSPLCGRLATADALRWIGPGGLVRRGS